jgi:hypothetical protein
MISIADTQDALIADVKANINGLKTVDVMEGEFSAKTLQEMILLAPFVLGSYRMPSINENERDAAGGSGMKKHQFMLIVGALSLLGKVKSQRCCLEIIDDIIERYDGKPLTVGSGSVPFGLGSIEPVLGDKGLVAYAVSLVTNDE